MAETSSTPNTETTDHGSGKPLTAVNGVGDRRYGKLANAGYITFQDIRNDPGGVDDVTGVGGWLAARLRQEAGVGVDIRCPRCDQRFAPSETTGIFDGTTALYRCQNCSQRIEGPPPA